MRGITCEVSRASRDPDVTVHRPRSSSSARERSSSSRPANNTGDAFARIPLQADGHERRRDRARPEAPTSRSARNAARASVSAKNDPDARGRSRSRQCARARPSAALSRARVARGSGEKASRANPVLDRSASRGKRNEVDYSANSRFVVRFFTPRARAPLFSRDAASASRSIWTGRSRPQTTCLSRTLARDGTGPAFRARHSRQRRGRGRGRRRPRLRRRPRGGFRARRLSTPRAPSSSPRVIHVGGRGRRGALVSKEKHRDQPDGRDEDAARRAPPGRDPRTRPRRALRPAAGRADDALGLEMGRRVAARRAGPRALELRRVVTRREHRRESRGSDAARPRENAKTSRVESICAEKWYPSSREGAAVGCGAG